MKPRLTVFENENGILEIYLNESCRDEMIEALKSLDKNNDHIHLAPEEHNMEDIHTSRLKYSDTDKIFEWAKICLRPDDWDQKYYPHVMKDQNHLSDN